MKILYLDIFGGISGDMFLGALIDLGVDFVFLRDQLAKLPVTGYHLHADRVQRQNISGTKFDVHLKASEHHHHHHHHFHSQEPPAPSDHGHIHEHGHEHKHSHLYEQEHEEGAKNEEPEHTHHRSLADITRLVEASPYSPWVKEKAISIFQRIAVAESRIHGCAPDEVHFHEVGAVDSIVDIVGACLALESLGKPGVMAGEVTEGTGWIHCAHGRLPLPAPATLAILGARNIPITQCEESNEMVTPTGAALLAEFAQSFGPMKRVTASRIGYGFGSRQHKNRLNALRVILGEEPAGRHDWERDVVSVIQTNIDDLPGEIVGNFMNTALQAGALDVYFTSIQMKKNRPGVELTLLCPESVEEELMELLFKETGTLGVRIAHMERRKLQRQSSTLMTRYGQVILKQGLLDGQVVNSKPEYESCHQLAKEKDLPIRMIYDAAREAERKHS